MISKASGKFIRISPRKSRLVADMVRGKSIDEAQAILANLEKRARLYILQILKSAIANATNEDPDLSPGNLYVSKITIDNGPMFKRYRAGSMGRAMMIKHRTSHMLIELDKKQEKSPVKKVKKQVTGDRKPATKGKAKVKKMAQAKKGK